MTRYGSSFPLVLAVLFCLPAAGHGQVKFLDRVKDKVDDARESADVAAELRCDVQGVCGEVTAAEYFAPGTYSSLAVTFVDGSNRFRAAPVDGLVRGILEGQLMENGFLMAASADVAEVQKRIARGEGGWTDDELAQLKDFIHGIDAVLVAEVGQVDLARCELDAGVTGTEATVHLVTRWLNVDAGDIPWIGRHAASACEDGGSRALTAALEKTTEQLAGVLPTYP